MKKLILLLFLSSCAITFAQKATIQFNSKVELISLQLQLNPDGINQIKSDTLATELLYTAIKDPLDLIEVQNFTNSYLKDKDAKELEFSLEFLKKAPKDALLITLADDANYKSNRENPLKFDNVDQLLKYVDSTKVLFVEEMKKKMVLSK